jgi:hypothetical protein
VLIGGGPRAFQKYETGDLLPSRAISSALLLLDRDPEALGGAAACGKAQRGGRQGLRRRCLCTRVVTRWPKAPSTPDTYAATLWRASGWSVLVGWQTVGLAKACCS